MTGNENDLLTIDYCFRHVLVRTVSWFGRAASKMHFLFSKVVTRGGTEISTYQNEDMIKA